MFYNPMQLPGMAEMSSCGGYYHHELVRTPDGWRSRRLREENVWFVNSPADSPDPLCRLAKRTLRNVSRPNAIVTAGTALGRQLTAGGGDFAATGVAHRA